MAAFGIGILLAPILGPTLGGWITDNYSWRWIFYLNLPVGALSLFLMNKFVFDPHYVKRSNGARVDLWGIGFLAVGIGSLQILLDTGQRKDWFSSHYIQTFAALCVFGLVALIIRELMTDHPVVDLRVLSDRSFSAGVFLISMLGFVLYASLVLAAALSADADGISRVQLGPGAVSAGHRRAALHPLGRTPDHQDGSAAAARRGHRPRLDHHVRSLRAQSLRRVLGHLLGAGPAGSRAQFSVHSAHVAGDVAHLATEDGKRDQHLQPDAQHRRQRGHRPDDHVPGPALPGAPEPSGGERHRGQPADCKTAARDCRRTSSRTVSTASQPHARPWAQSMAWCNSTRPCWRLSRPSG